MTDKEKLDKIRKWAEDRVNCSHALCSMAEGIWEEVHGKEILAILDATEDSSDKTSHV